MKVHNTSVINNLYPLIEGRIKAIEAEIYWINRKTHRIETIRDTEEMIYLRDQYDKYSQELELLQQLETYYENIIY